MTLRDGKIVYELNGLSRPDWTTLPKGYRSSGDPALGRESQLHGGLNRLLLIRIRGSTGRRQVTAGRRTCPSALRSGVRAKVHEFLLAHQAVR